MVAPGAARNIPPMKNCTLSEITNNNITHMGSMHF